MVDSRLCGADIMQLQIIIPCSNDQQMVIEKKMRNQKSTGSNPRRMMKGTPGKPHELLWGYPY
jgi:hypothetical protein